MKTEALLIEIGTEELPPKALKNLSNAFSEGLIKGLLDAELIGQAQADEAKSFASPRRLALQIPD